MSNQTYSDDDLKRVAGIKDEQMQARFSLLVEGIDAILEKRLAPIEADVHDLTTDIKTVNAVLSETNRDLKLLTKRTEKLEQYTEETAEHGIRLTAVEKALHLQS